VLQVVFGTPIDVGPLVRFVIDYAWGDSVSADVVTLFRSLRVLPRDHAIATMPVYWEAPTDRSGSSADVILK